MILMVGFLVYKTTLYIRKEYPIWDIWSQKRRCPQPFRDIVTAAQRAHFCVQACICVSAHWGLHPAFWPFEPVAMQLATCLSLACNSQKQSSRPNLCWAAGAVEVIPRFFWGKKKAENKNFPLGAGKLRKWAHKALELLVNGVSITRSPAQGA